MGLGEVWTGGPSLEEPAETHGLCPLLVELRPSLSDPTLGSSWRPPRPLILRDWDQWIHWYRHCGGEGR